MRRMPAIEEAVETARPEDSIGLAVQARYLERWLHIGSNENQIAVRWGAPGDVGPARRGRGQAHPEVVQAAA
jgi:hypothetical protein